VDPLVKEGALDTDQQMVGQHTQKDVSFDPALQMMKAARLLNPLRAGAIRFSIRRIEARSIIFSEV
jgi:hypothetical protein